MLSALCMCCDMQIESQKINYLWLFQFYFVFFFFWDNKDLIKLTRSLWVVTSMAGCTCAPFHDPGSLIHRKVPGVFGNVAIEKQCDWAHRIWKTFSELLNNWHLANTTFESTMWMRLVWMKRFRWSCGESHPDLFFWLAENNCVVCLFVLFVVR